LKKFLFINLVIFLIIGCLTVLYISNAKDRTLVLDRLIEEELLVQKAVNDGALRNNLSVRQRTLQTMLDSIQSDAVAANGSNAESSDKALEGYIEQLRTNATIEWLSPPSIVKQARQ